jgi:hypothetical protein
MIGAQISKDAGLERRFYLESRANLETAELHDDTSQFATIESAQTLLLLARYELTHGAFQRALMTFARLAQLLLILYPHVAANFGQRDQSGSPSNLSHQSSATAADPPIQLGPINRARRNLVLLAFSLYYVLPHGLAYEALLSNNSVSSPISFAPT